MIELVLKKRREAGVLSVSIEALEAILARGNRDELWNMLAKEDWLVHDVKWFELIVNWAPPEGGVPMTEMAKWLPLARKVGRVNAADGATLRLTKVEADLIWSRLNDERFKLRSLSAGFAEFVLEFCEVGGYHFASVQDDPEAEVANETPRV